MSFSVEQIANMISGAVEGNANAVINGVAKIETAGEGDLAFLANTKYTHFLYSSNATAVIVSNGIELHASVKPALIRVPDPYSSFAKMLALFEDKVEKHGVSSLAFIGKDVVMGDDVYIAPMAFVGDNVTIGNRVKIYPHACIGDNCTIDDDTVVYSNVSIYNKVRVGKRCVLHSGSVIGADGFGFARQADGSYNKIPQTGIVILMDDVEIGANTTVDRATMGATVINKGVKLDNQVMIAHNVEIGENTVMAAQSGVSGSTKIGKNCTFGGQSGMAGHITIADGVTIGAQSGVLQSVKDEGQVFLGSPVMPVRDCMKVYVHTRNLDKIVGRINELEKKISELERNK